MDTKHGFDRDIGEFRARITVLESEMAALRADVREIRDAILTVRGGWKVLALVIGLSASLGAALTSLLPLLMWPRG
ncbi:hypothetical protein BH10PSE7_BH10PSE7_03770 [soil metagenome]